MEAMMKAEEDLNSTLKVFDRLDITDHSTRNGAIAKNVLDEELGRFEDTPRNYSIDKATRDRLLVHGRQDVAHALLNTIILTKALVRNEGRFEKWWRAGWCVLGVAAVFGYLFLAKPECASGFVAGIVPGTGWTCLAGYKP
jgi:hypothetical protein